MDFEQKLGAFYDILSGTTLGTFGLNIPILSAIPIFALLLLGTGFYLTFALRFMPIFRIPAGFVMLWKGRKPKPGHEGEITPFAALMTALSSTVGTGNLAGVATAITLGGPGAIFWMWMTALVGMATKYAESLLAVRYREVDDNGVFKGGPMYYIKNGLGPKWKWLAWLFCIGAMAGALGAGNMVQSNSITNTFNGNIGGGDNVKYIIGAVLAALTFMVIIGGIKSIGKIASKLVPIMALGYVTAAIIVLILNASGIPSAFKLIFTDAFNGHAAVGGFTGAVIAEAIRFGVARGLFSNEAGQGSAPIAHAAAQTRDPVQQATIGMLGTFIDTIVICTMTALVILTVGGNFKYNPAVNQLRTCASAIEKIDSEASSKIEITDEIIKASYGKTIPIKTWYGKVTDEVTPADVVTVLDQCKALNSAEITIDSIAYEAVLENKRIPVKHAWQTNLEGASITSAAFNAGIPGGKWIITFALMVFAFTTILGWSYYGERAIAFLFGEKAVLPFKFIWCGAVFLGAVIKLGTVWVLGDIGNIFMATPNLIAIILLSGIVISMTRGGKSHRKVEHYDESAHAKGMYSTRGIETPFDPTDDD